MKDIRVNILLCLLFVMSLRALAREDIIVEDFESGSYKTNGWITKGNAFGSAPAQGTWPGQNTVSGYQGERLVNTFGEGDGPMGTLTSDTFLIERPYMNFLLGGGAVSGERVELYVEGECVYSSTPIAQANDVAQERLYARTWDLQDYQNQAAVIRIVDSVDGGWGHINVDYFCLSDTAASDLKMNYLTTIHVTDKYMQVPVNAVSPCVDFNFLSMDGAFISGQRFRFATSQPTLYLPVYTGHLLEQDIKIQLGSYYENSHMIDSIYFTATPEIEAAEHPYRPIYHHAPAYGWMNDPNGMVYFNNKYHLFYQHYPYDSHWQMMHWGHAVSEDLIHWTTEPIALFPDENGDIFSGSIVVDSANTAGFGENAFVAVYTTTSPRQAQSIAYSLDEGKTWHKYGAPVLWNYDIWDFRDPKVCWNPRMNCWIMTLAANTDVQFFRSDNLINWERILTWGSSLGQHGAAWECPDLLLDVPVDGTNETMDVLLVSINPCGPQGGSATQYFIGEFQGNGFKLNTSNNQQARWMDWGKDNYAGVTFSGYRDYKKRPVLIGWMSNWQYAGDTPPAESSFRSANTFPRALSIMRIGDDLVLRSEPVAHLSGLRSDSVYTFTPGTINTTWTTGALDSIQEGAYIVEWDMPNIKQGWKMTLQNSLGEKVRCRYMSATNAIMVDRRNSGIVDFSTVFAGQFSAKMTAEENTRHVMILVDKSSVELFINRGRLVQTNLVYPRMPYNEIVIEPENSRSSLVIDSLKVTKIGHGQLNLNPIDDDVDAVSNVSAKTTATKMIIGNQIVINRNNAQYTILGTHL